MPVNRPTSSPTRSPKLTTPKTKPAPRQPAAADTKRTDKGGWNASSAAVGRELRAMLTSQPGREKFAELLENQLNDPSATTGYVWDPADNKAMQWTLRAQEMGDDSILVKISGKELSILSESSGFEGKASFKGTSLEGLNDAIVRAVKDLDRKTEAERG